ncbi:hypothetical protein TWF694_001287 [Orbilia ellipsospora]|uniref:J domain-containing protein n=1 Tax=Orbilia ellipsospora TaxID=2528407 RepID=A0AAV9XRC9_9PEZI
MFLKIENQIEFREKFRRDADLGKMRLPAKQTPASSHTFSPRAPSPPNQQSQPTAMSSSTEEKKKQEEPSKAEESDGEVEIDKESLSAIEREELEFRKDSEIQRILNAFKLDAYAVLDLQPGVPESDIKMQYRKKSLLIHPDKTKNPQAPDAFDRLKKAQNELMDEKARTRLDEAIADARMLLIRERKWTVDHPDLQSEAFKRDWREKTKEVLIDNELRRRKQIKAQLAEEGREQRKADAEAEAKKRKRDNEQAWEDTRDQRISSWRDFQKGKQPSKKKKMKPIG